MTPAKFSEYRKAVGAFLGLAISGIGSILALGILSGPISHDLALASAISAALLVPLGAAVAPANVVPVPVTPVPTPQALVNALTEAQQFIADVQAALAGTSAPGEVAPPG